MAFKDLNDEICLDLDDMMEQNKNIPFFENLNQEGRVFVRTVAKKDIICKGQLIKKGQKGAYIEAKILRLQERGGNLVKIWFCKPLVKIGKNSWISGGATGTKFMESFVGRGVVVENNTFIGRSVTINDNVAIGNNCLLEDCIKIDKKSIIGNNCKFKMMTTIGANTYIGDNTKNIISCQGVKVGITPLYEKKYVRAQKYKVEKRKPIRDTNTIFSKTIDTFNALKVVAKYNFENLKEKYYANKITRIGENVVIKSGAKIFSGATVGNGAVLGVNSQIKSKAEVENQTIVPDFASIEK
ncbi:MAG: hypothetical protein PHQ62_01895 [Clostridia bacterium]|nr:hypothetical protein [Clostridia bacterium]